MDIEDHHRRFLEIVEKYDLSDDQKASEIADFLTSKDRTSVDSEEFAVLFAMEEEEARIFLSFIDKGIRFKDKHVKK